MGAKNMNKRSSIYFTILTISVIGIIMNLGGYVLNQKVFMTPLYLDAVGTIFVAATVGALPGMLVGYFSILISSIIESSQMYYSIISVLIALMVGYAASKGAFRNIFKTLLILPPMVVMDTVVGMGLNWTGFFDSSPVYLTDVSASSSHAERFLSELVSTVILEIGDKLLSLVIVFLILKLLHKVFKKDPYSFVERDMFAVSWNDPKGWRVKHSLRQTVAIALAVTGLVMEVISLIFIYSFYRSDTTGEYELAARVMTESAHQIVLSGYATALKGDTDQITLERVEKLLNEEMEQFPELRALYIYVEENGEKRVAVYTGREEEVVARGEVLPEIKNRNIVYLDEPVKGVMGIGTLVYYSKVDIKKDSLNYCLRLFSVMLGVLLCIMAIIIVVADRHLVWHINRMTDAMTRFAYNSDEERLQSVEAIKALNIRNGNELEALYRSIYKTVDDYTSYIEDANRKAEEINRIQVNIISTIADLVESRDEHTGQHTKRTSEYVNAIAKELVKEGKFTDILTEEYVEDMTVAASLHDIGKICISDTVLNKPGRLDKDEFEIMKGHTTAGRQIIIDIRENLGDTDYLRIATEMAGSHHEWWDGTRGYPDHLKGEEIPLSARIMAIADVFDALISVRPYKKAFTIEEAVNIIREEKGTHFMPEIVDAFDAALDELVAISARF